MVRREHVPRRQTAVRDVKFTLAICHFLFFYEYGYRYIDENTFFYIYK